MTRAIGAVVWLVVIISFTATAVGIFGQTDWWRTLAIFSAVVSGIGLILVWSTTAGSSVFFALGFNVIVLIALLVFNFPHVSPTQAVSGVK